MSSRFAMERNLILAFAVSNKTVSRIPAGHGHSCWTRYNKIIDRIQNIVGIRIGKARNKRGGDSRTVRRHGNETPIIAAYLLSEVSNQQKMIAPDSYWPQLTVRLEHHAHEIAGANECCKTENEN